MTCGMKCCVFVAGAVAAVTFGAGAVETGPFPNVGDYQVLRCDFHIHTPHSDGELSPVERVEEAVKFGYDAVAITDHGNFKAYDEALPRAKELNLVLIRGMETGLDGREHMVALDFDPSYEPRNSHHWALERGQEKVFYQDQLTKLAKGAGAFMIYAHPHVGYEEPVEWGVKQGFIRGIEVKNGVVGKEWNTVHSHGTWFYPHALDYAIEHNLAVLADSDAHEARNETNSPVTLVLAGKRSPEGVMDALKAGRSIAWFDGMLWGKEAVLAEAVKSFVSVTGDNGKIHIENNCPAALTAGLPDGSKLEVKPNGSASADLKPPGAGAVIRWQNLWVTSTENLETRHVVEPN